tara:strand:- start:130 stop:504 length:375 start_codon:yes stop_codon:yes gene_type:complete
MKIYPEDVYQFSFTVKIYGGSQAEAEHNLIGQVGGMHDLTQELDPWGELASSWEVIKSSLISRVEESEWWKITMGLKVKGLTPKKVRAARKAFHQDGSNENGDRIRVYLKPFRNPNPTQTQQEK